MTLDFIYGEISKSNQVMNVDKDYMVNVFAFGIKKFVEAITDYKTILVSHECFRILHDCFEKCIYKSH